MIEIQLPQNGKKTVMTKIIDGSRYQIVVQRLVGLTEWVAKVPAQPTETSPPRAVVDEPPLRVIPRTKPALMFSRLECWSTRSRSYRKIQRRLARKQAAASREAAREAARLQADINNAEVAIQPRVATIGLARQREAEFAAPAPVRPVEQLREERDNLHTVTKNRLILQTWKKIIELRSDQDLDEDELYRNECTIFEQAAEKARKSAEHGNVTRDFLAYWDWLQARLIEWDLDPLDEDSEGLEGVDDY